MENPCNVFDFAILMDFNVQSNRYEIQVSFADRKLSLRFPYLN
jgi:hypothetical protein